MRSSWQLFLLTGALLGALGETTAEAHEGSQPAPCSVPDAARGARADANGPPVRVAVGVLLLEIIPNRFQRLDIGVNVREYCDLHSRFRTFI